METGSQMLPQSNDEEESIQIQIKKQVYDICIPNIALQQPVMCTINFECPIVRDCKILCKYKYQINLTNILHYKQLAQVLDT